MLQKNDNIFGISIAIFLFLSGFFTNSLVQKYKTSNEIQFSNMKPHRGHNLPRY